MCCRIRPRPRWRAAIRLDLHHTGDHVAAVQRRPEQAPSRGDRVDGKLLGWFGTTGKKVGQFYWVHQMHCVSENEIITGEAQNWRVQRIVMKPAK